ncbi:hypothetical protein sync_0824 [Synechococcus sp. CC9311]|nr:hypothetical protein sync_0824 [Synechococcus sp. CC9311]
MLELSGPTKVIGWDLVATRRFICLGRSKARITPVEEVHGPCEGAAWSKCQEKAAFRL